MLVDFTLTGFVVPLRCWSYIRAGHASTAILGIPALWLSVQRIVQYTSECSVWPIIKIPLKTTCWLRVDFGT